MIDDKQYPAHSPRPKFDTLFTDARHYRGDLRLMRTAIRRGWLDDAPQADRDALVARFEHAMTERDEQPGEARTIRATLAACRAAIALSAANLKDDRRALRHAWAAATGTHASTTGRPRERWHVANYAHRIDANELRRRAMADGIDLRTLQAIDLPGDVGGRIALSVVADARYGWRVWLVCPRCGRRRVYLYTLKRGAMCRQCGRVGYSQ